MNLQLSEEYLFRFGGIARMYGMQGLRKIAQSRVLVIGLGGVGSWVVEAIARTGFQKITLVDLDDVCASNTNRQIQATISNVGKSKAISLKERILEINPASQVETIIEFYNSETADIILNGQIDFVFDCIDSIDKKAHLIHQCYLRKIPFITCGGVGGKKDPTKIRIGDLSCSENDPLLKNLKKNLRKVYSFPSADKKMRVNCVYSVESAVFPSPDGELCLTKSDHQKMGMQNSQSMKLDCRSGFGAVSFLSGSVGFAMVSFAVDQLLKRNE